VTDAPPTTPPQDTAAQLDDCERLLLAQFIEGLKKPNPTASFLAAATKFLAAAKAKVPPKPAAPVDPAGLPFSSEETGPAVTQASPPAVVALDPALAAQLPFKESDGAPQGDCESDKWASLSSRPFVSD